MSSFANNLALRLQQVSLKQFFFLRTQEIPFGIYCILNIQFLFHMEHLESTCQIFLFICLLENQLENYNIIVQNVVLLQLLPLKLQVCSQSYINGIIQFRNILMPTVTRPKNVLNVIIILLEHINTIHHHVFNGWIYTTFLRYWSIKNNHIEVRVWSCKFGYLWGNILHW